MLKNKPWQIWALIAVHSATLAYVLFELVRRTLLYATAGTGLVAPAVFGAAVLFFLLRGSLTGLILEILYFISLFFCLYYPIDIIAVIVLTAVFALQKPSRGFFKSGGRVNTRRTITVTAVTVAVAVSASVFLYNIDSIFYVTHSKQDLNRITEYVTETYGSGAVIDESSYKQLGYVFVTTADGESGSVEIRSGMVFDEIIFDKLEKQYRDKINEGLESEEYSIYFYPSFENPGKINASINMYVRPRSGPEIYDESSLNRVYQMFLELIGDGYEVSVSPSAGIFPMGVYYVDTRSLLFPFLNGQVSENDQVPPSTVTFTEKCSAKEFTQRINENIQAAQLYELTHMNEVKYGRNRLGNLYNMTVAISILLTLPFYILEALALYAMTERRGLSKPWLAWIPHFSRYSLAKISDDADPLHHCGKGLAGRTLVIFALEILCGIIQAAVDTRNFVMGLCVGIVTIAAFVTWLQSAFRVYDSYSPQSAAKYKVLSFLFSPFSIPIILFIIRNRCPDESVLNPQGDAGEEEKSLGGMFTRLSGRLYDMGYSGADSDDMAEDTSASEEPDADSDDETDEAKD